MTNYTYQNDLPDDLNLGKFVAIDTETMGLKVKSDRLCVLQISSGDGDAHLVQFDNGYDFSAPNLRKILEDQSVQKIFHFARFDINMLNFNFNIELKNIFCTKIASKLVRTYSDHHGLKSLLSEILGVEISKQQQSSYWGTDKLSKKQINYAASDVLYLHDLKDNLVNMLKKESKFDLAQECFKFLEVRSKIDLIGLENIDIFSH
ncbi:ribonuclease D [Rickettsiales bacterium]|nr:ribonuclease D [Rickettsiales bacterium]